MLLERLKLKIKQTEVWRSNLKTLQDHDRPKEELQNAQELLRRAEEEQQRAQQNYDRHGKSRQQRNRKQEQRRNNAFKVGDKVQVNNRESKYRHQEGVVSYAPEGRFVKGTKATIKTDKYSYEGHNLRHGDEVIVRKIGEDTVDVQIPGRKRITVKKRELEIIVDDIYVVRIDEEYLNFKESELKEPSKGPVRWTVETGKVGDKVWSRWGIHPSTDVYPDGRSYNYTRASRDFAAATITKIYAEKGRVDLKFIKNGAVQRFKNPAIYNVQLRSDGSMQWPMPSRVSEDDQWYRKRYQH